ncbi:hypothetical protein K3G63_06750 [Hymenobacter sp. HSC-4F20]|uniref:hypothetical protein n=1 Tax=Hymenobacter sp. HSC-4F20 TaxID=2864135 RepID=UPI001C73626F|nr:hypothetical protein [Hymenobacter sp. HSC-4F20]MBX0290130.1 hypothetical protein [Hymenobacter sp. HSC-4F20]
MEVVFPSLALNVGKIEVLHFSWQKGEWVSYELVASIKVEGAAPYEIGVTNDMMEQAKALASRFEVNIPEKPKTGAELARELRANRNKANPEDYITK